MAGVAPTARTLAAGFAAAPGTAAGTAETGAAGLTDGAAALGTAAGGAGAGAAGVTGLADAVAGDAGFGTVAPGPAAGAATGAALGGAGGRSFASRDAFSAATLAVAAAASASARPRKCLRTFSAAGTSIELEWVTFSVKPTSGKKSISVLALISSSRASSLMRILLGSDIFRIFPAPRRLRKQARHPLWSVRPRPRLHPGL